MNEGNAKWNALADKPESNREVRAEAARLLCRRTAKIIGSRNKLTPVERLVASMDATLQEGIEPHVEGRRWTAEEKHAIAIVKGGAR